MPELSNERRRLMAEQERLLRAGVPIESLARIENLDETLTGNPDGVSASIDPDCRSGKHATCTGTGWDEDADALTHCECPCHGFD